VDAPYGAKNYLKGKGVVPYEFGYIYFYEISVEEGEWLWELPNNEDILIFAASIVTKENLQTKPLQIFYD